MSDLHVYDGIINRGHWTALIRADFDFRPRLRDGSIATFVTVKRTSGVPDVVRVFATRSWLAADVARKELRRIEKRNS